MHAYVHAVRIGIVIHVHVSTDVLLVQYGV